MLAIERLAIAGSTLSGLVDARARWTGLERWETGHDVWRLPSLKRRDVLAGARLEKLIDQRLHFGRQLKRAEAWPELNAVAAAIARRISALKAQAPDRPVIVAPFHYVSQYANIYVVDELRRLLGLQSIGVVTGVPRNQYGDDDALIPGIEVMHTYSGENRNALGLRVIRSLRRHGVVVLFADVPPYTFALSDGDSGRRDVRPRGTHSSRSVSPWRAGRRLAVAVLFALRARPVRRPAVRSSRARSLGRAAARRRLHRARADR